MKYFIFIALLVCGCNPAKRLRHKIDNAQKITDYVNTINPVKAKPDSVVFIPGITVTQKDTLKIQKDSVTIYEITTRINTRDTVKIVTEDTRLLNSYYRENERLKAESLAGGMITEQDKKYLRWSVAVNILLLIMAGFMAAKMFRL